MNKFLLFIIFLTVSAVCMAQQPPIVYINETSKQIDNADELIDRAWKLAKKALSDRSMAEAKERCREIIKLADDAEKISSLAEKKADEAEQAYQKENCMAAASEADDAEDYCRHLGYHTHEMLIYARKAMNEQDEAYFRAYLNKVIAYAEESYESVKNAKIELEEATKDAEACKQ